MLAPNLISTLAAVPVHHCDGHLRHILFGHGDARLNAHRLLHDLVRVRLRGQFTRYALPAARCPLVAVNTISQFTLLLHSSQCVDNIRHVLVSGQLFCAGHQHDVVCGFAEGNFGHLILFTQSLLVYSHHLSTGHKTKKSPQPFSHNPLFTLRSP